MDATAFGYHYVTGFARGPVKAGGTAYVSGGAVVNGPAATLRKAGGMAGVDGGAVRAEIGTTGLWMLHARADFFTRNGSGAPLAARLVHGCGGRQVPWGVLQEVTEIEESDVQVWTATSGIHAGKAAGVALLNPRISASLTAIFLIGIDPPARGNIFQYRRANGQNARMICLKVTRQWSNASFLAVQIEGTEWDSPLSRAA